MKSMAYLLGGMGILLAPVILIFGTIGAFLWPYIITSWAAYFGSVVTVAWYKGFILGLIPFI